MAYLLHNFSLLDNYKIKVDKDINAIDARIYDGMDEIGVLKLDQFLSDLGIKKISPKNVIESHIIPSLQTGRWKEKEDLIVPYLIFVKETHDRDESNVDLEVLKECAIISTNHGNVKLTEKQIYFNPKFEQMLDLKNKFPSKNYFYVLCNMKLNLDTCSSTPVYYEQCTDQVTFRLQG